MKNISNSTARFWKKSQLNQTVKQAKERGFIVYKEGDTTEIIDPTTTDVILRSMFTGKMELVRIDQSYFK